MMQQQSTSALSSHSAQHNRVHDHHRENEHRVAERRQFYESHKNQEGPTRFQHSHSNRSSEDVSEGKKSRGREESTSSLRIRTSGYGAHPVFGSKDSQCAKQHTHRDDADDDVWWWGGSTVSQCCSAT
ncbi:unnamed protein product [Pleuronectes platessa]|uniref:Uncharacterized protein n=1 Tax=Pleuronectes platessa TaxID=8262 RepID=A0A9N7UKP0_PLEPL|nr:unnamed protein product [Pleuronectes platessa]